MTFGCTNYRIICGEEQTIIDGQPTVVLGVVMVHGQIIAEGEDASGRHAKAAASEIALKKLKGMMLPDYRKEYGCNCNDKPGQEQKAVEEE